MRVWGAAGRGCHIPDWLGIAPFARSSYVNRAFFGISTDGRLDGSACLACPVMDTCVRLGSRWARLPLTGLAGEGALCALLLCKSCFIRDIDRCGPMARFPGAYDLLVLSWVHMRVRAAAGRGWVTPASTRMYFN